MFSGHGLYHGKSEYCSVLGRLNRIESLKVAKKAGLYKPLPNYVLFSVKRRSRGIPWGLASLAIGYKLRNTVYSVLVMGNSAILLGFTALYTVIGLMSAW